MELYRFSNDKWVETKSLTYNDVALLIDTNAKTVYIWEGEFSTSKIKQNAVSNLETMRLKYPNFKFRIVSSEIYPEVSQFLKEALKGSENVSKKYEADMELIDRIQLILSMISLAFVLISMLWFIILLSIQPNIGTNNQIFIPIGFDLVTIMFKGITIFMFLSTILNAFNLAFSVLQKKLFKMTNFLITIIIQLIIVLWYWNYIFDLLLVFQTEINEIVMFSIPKSVFDEILIYNIIIFCIIIYFVIATIVFKPKKSQIPSETAAVTANTPSNKPSTTTN